MAKESSTTEQRVPSLEFNPTAVGSPALELARPLDDLEAMLLEKFAGQTLSVRKLYEEHSVDRRYISKNYKDALTNLEAAGGVTADPPAHKRPKRKGKVTMADTVQITFPHGGA